jgi:hypothetical protein
VLEQTNKALFRAATVEYSLTNHVVKLSLDLLCTLYILPDNKNQPLENKCYCVSS